MHKSATKKTSHFSFFILFFFLGFQLIAQPPSHDPTEIVKEGDRYWCFNTGRGVWAMSASKPDFSDWKAAPSVFKNGTFPDWINDYVSDFGGHFWAPAIIHMNGKWHIYYSCSSFGSQNSTIGLATTESMASGEWEDQGMVTFSNSSWKVNAIDADIFKDNNGKVWMLYGSFWSGIAITELDSTTGKPINVRDIKIVANGNPEAGHMAIHDNYYYLFFNRGKCCEGINSTYQVFMGRSENPTGPFLDKDGKDCAKGGGSTFLHSDGRFVGPGHFGLYDTLVSYHYYDGLKSGQSFLKVATLKWVDGWPVAKYESKGGISEGPFALQNMNSRKVLEVEDASTDDGANVYQATETGAENQQWTFEYMDNTYFKISPLHAPGKVLSIANCSPSNAANAIITEYTGEACQEWYIARMGSVYRIMNRNSKQTLEIKNALTTDGANAQQWPFNENNTQKWMAKWPKVTGISSSKTDNKKTLIYPNPTKGNFTLDLSAIKTDEIQLSIFNMSGKQVFTNILPKTNTFKFTKKLQPGMYLVRVAAKDKTQTEILILE